MKPSFAPLKAGIRVRPSWRNVRRTRIELRRFRSECRTAACCSIVTPAVTRRRSSRALRGLGLWDDNAHNYNQPRRSENSQQGRINGDRSIAALNIWQLTKPGCGRLVETYLRSRGLTIPPPPILRFCPTPDTSRNSGPAGFATAIETASYLRLSKAMVHKLIAAGSIPAVRYGRAVRIPWVWLRLQAGE